MQRSRYHLFHTLSIGFKESKSRNKCYYYDFNLPGYDLNGNWEGNSPVDGCSDKTDTARECRKLCYLSKECAQFTWIDKTFHDGKRYKDCCMKKIYRNHYVHSVGAISGLKYCNTERYEGTFHNYSLHILM